MQLWARDFYEVIVDEAEGRINYNLIQIESESSNCFGRIPTEISFKKRFQLFLVWEVASRFREFERTDLSI